MPYLFRRKLAQVVAFIVFANIADLLSTYIASPNLADEWNVLQRHFNLGWAGLIVAKLIGGSLAAAGYCYYLRHRDECYPEALVTEGAFRRHFTFGRESSRVNVWTSIPVGVHLGVNVGYFWTGMQALVLWVALDNILLHYGFVFPMRQASEAGYHLVQSGIVALFVLAQFYRGNYRRYLSLRAPREARAESGRMQMPAPADATA